MYIPILTRIHKTASGYTPAPPGDTGSPLINTDKIFKHSAVQRRSWLLIHNDVLDVVVMSGIQGEPLDNVQDGEEASTTANRSRTGQETASTILYVCPGSAA
jgi:hypothetical protein